MMDRQTITPALAGLVALYRARTDGFGGPLHIWFDDGNFERNHVAWLAGYCRHDREGGWHPDEDTRRLGAYIARIAALYLTDTQRRRLPGVHDGR